MELQTSQDPRLHYRTLDCANRLEELSPVYREDAEYLMTRLFADASKAAFLEAPPKKGKTTLALMVAELLSTEYGIESRFTTPQIQQTIGAIAIEDESSGAIFSKLPKADSISEDNPLLIVIDEISQRKPNNELWKPYIDNPGTRFIVLTHPNSKTVDTWSAVFGDNKIDNFELNN